MSIDFAKCRRYLKDFDFANLFREELGWELNDQTLSVVVEDQEYNLEAIAEKHGFVVFQCSTDYDIPKYSLRLKIDSKVTKSVYHHLIIYTDKDQTVQTWQWVKRESGKPVLSRYENYSISQSGDALLQKIRHLAFTIKDEEEMTLFKVYDTVSVAFYAEKVTKKFYTDFRKELDCFVQFLKGIPDEDIQSWYASVILDRLMFIYFIQKKEFIDGNPSYLKNKLALSKSKGKDQYYKKFLCPLFFEGFAKKEEERSPEINKLLGKVPYLNGGLFLKHEIEEKYPNISIPDKTFEKLFIFFDDWVWHLDDRPLKSGREINPDVLGYIFEKYINQKQMGAYYSKEDITGYISKNTVVPSIFDKAELQCKIAFEGEHTIWDMLTEDSDKYIYNAVKHGITVDIHAKPHPRPLEKPIPLPPEIEVGINDVSKRTEWNKPAPEEYALPTEIWREVVARRERYQEVNNKLANGEIRSINDFITYNIDITQFAQDVIQNCEGPELLRAFWKAINSVTVLDPACGSGAFLFAALNILESLYEGCLQRMRVFIEELERSDEKHRPEKYSDFKKILEQIENHPNERYFIFKSIIINNLYGVDIMEEAVEICKLRMFLKLVAQVEDVNLIEPLPDIDFNIRSGNSLVGYISEKQIEQAIKYSQEGQAKLIYGEVAKVIDDIKEKAETTASAFDNFKTMQLKEGMDSNKFTDAKTILNQRLNELENELNRYLASEYNVKTNSKSFQDWKHSHKPFHWFVDFYEIMTQGGFDVIIGNPPYVNFKKIDYTIPNDKYNCFSCKDLFAIFTERSYNISQKKGRIGLIIPLSATSTNPMIELKNLLSNESVSVWTSYYSASDQPASLFNGVRHRLLILLSQVGCTKIKKRYSTRFLKWFSQERNFLFQSILQYIDTQKNNLPEFVKISSLNATNVYHKIRNRGKQLSAHISQIGKCIFFHNAPVHWGKVFDYVPYFKVGNNPPQQSSHIKKICFPTSNDANASLCLLNSSLFYWFNWLFTNCRDLSFQNIGLVPVGLDTMEESIKRELSELKNKLMVDYKKNSKIYRRVSNDIVTEFDSFYPMHSKEILDRIDEVLAEHYGFSTNELDFIINYDIKYRMGLNSG